MLPLVGGVLALLLWQGWRVAAARANA
jgi:hypothetical protein